METPSPPAADTSIIRRILSLSNLTPHPPPIVPRVCTGRSRLDLLLWLWCWFPSEDHYGSDYSEDGADNEASEAEEAQDGKDQYQYSPCLSLRRLETEHYGR